MVNADDLSDRLEQLGRFELFLDSTEQRSSAVWLTEAERDMIVIALRHWIAPSLSPAQRGGGKSGPVCQQCGDCIPERHDDSEYCWLCYADWQRIRGGTASSPTAVEDQRGGGK